MSRVAIVVTDDLTIGDIVVFNDVVCVRRHEHQDKLLRHGDRVLRLVFCIDIDKDVQVLSDLSRGADLVTAGVVIS